MYPEQIWDGLILDKFYPIDTPIDAIKVTP